MLWAVERVNPAAIRNGIGLVIPRRRNILFKLYFSIVVLFCFPKLMVLI
jgi:hypothetical protein